LSAVTIPANSEATITSVKAFDIEAQPVPGQRRGVVTLDPPSSPAAVGQPGKNHMTIKDQIAALEVKRAAHDARMEAIMTLSAEENRTRTPEELDEYKTLSAELDAMDVDLVDFRAREKKLVANATAIEATKIKSPESAATARAPQSHSVTVKSMAPKGIGVARMAIAVLNSHITHSNPMEMARRRWPDNPEVEMHIKAVIEAGDTTTSGWASQLVPAAQQMNDEFLEMLRNLIVMGRIPGLRNVPFNVSVPLQSGGGTYGYVGEGAPKPVTKPTYGSATLRFEKAAGIIVITEELARFSRPSAELLVRDELLKGLTEFFDGVFVGAAAAVTNVSPAGILNGISSTAVTGATAIKFRYDMNVIIQKMIVNKRDPSKLVLLMSSGQTMSLASMINSLGQQEFPTINAGGGNYLGIPIVSSQAVGTNIILLDPGDILLAEDPAIRIDVSREASIEMSDTPILGDTSPTTGATLKSFWQNNLVGLRAEQYRTWKVARTTAVEYLTGAAYAPPTS